MKLKYKISLTIAFFAIVALVSILLVYTLHNYKDYIKHEQDKLLIRAVDAANHIENELKSMLYITKTISSAPIVVEKLQQSNAYYSKLSAKNRTQEIDMLNRRWMSAQSDKSEFVRSYTDNELAKFLKEQQKLLPNTYGEIFITDRYGMTVATTNKLTTLKHAYKYWWRDSYDKGKGKIYFDDSGFDDSVQDYVIGITVPIKKDGQIIGIIKANILIIGILNNVLTTYNKQGRGTLKLVRSKGSIVLEQGLPPLSTNINPKLVKNLKNLDSGSRILYDYNKEKIFAYTPVLISLDNSNILFGGETQKLISTKSNQGEIWHTVVSYDKQKALVSLYKENILLVYIGAFFIILSTVIAFIVGSLISKPINRLSHIAKRIGAGEHDLKADVSSNDEVGALARSFNEMLDKLKSTMASRDELIEEIEKRKEAEVKLKSQEEIIISQSRQSAINDMINMLAHQWRQPIAAISMGANNILIDLELESLDTDTLKKTSNDILTQTKELSNTIENFKNFFKSEDKIAETSIEEVFNETLEIIGKSLKSSEIEVIKEFNVSHKLVTYADELMRVFLNILTNAQEALNENKHDGKKINFSAKEDDSSNIIINICNNGGTISKDAIDKIFEPYFTTKKKMVGTGIGLYMSRTIIEKHLHGTIEAKNIEDGVCFKIRIPLNIKEIK